MSRAQISRMVGAMEADAFPRDVRGLSVIRGQEAVVRALGQAIRQEKVHHAYLFAGPAGVGKATTAVALAQALACSGSPGQGCGTCGVCDRLARNVHPDLLWVQAETKQIKIEQIRGLEERMGQGAHEAGRLLIVIDEAERLNPNAANALLKNLEEPRSGVHFVLVSAAPHRLPVTVRSRCQRLRFGPLAVKELVAILERHGGVTGAAADAVARLAGGSARTALQFVENEELPRWQEWTQRLTLLDRAQDVPALVEQLLAEVEEVPVVLRLTLRRLRDHYLAAAGVDSAGARLELLDPDGEEIRTARRTSMDQVRHRLEAVLSALRDLDGYVNKTLALEHMILKMVR